MLPRIALTPGEPAGIGPEVTVLLAQRALPAQCVAIADPELLEQAARVLRKPLRLLRFDPKLREAAEAGALYYVPIALDAENEFGLPKLANARYVIASLQRAAAGCLSGEFDALVTGPVHKGVIAGAGIPFRGHTEFLQELAGRPDVVMMLIAGRLRVALATTHLPLRAVPDALSVAGLTRTLSVLIEGLRRQYGLARPRIAVLGLNPHAGEDGHLGDEEVRVIRPALTAVATAGAELLGPIAADTAFTPRILDRVDAVLAMYHDQGLPVLKHAGFGHAVNVTLGLPYVRTSVDHGVAFDLAGKALADPGSLEAAFAEALRLTALMARG